MRVISRNSASAYKGKMGIDVRQVGRELGAKYVVEGSVRKGPDTVRITAQLINTSTGEHVWAQKFDETGTDAFALQDRVTEKVAAAIAGERGQIRAAGNREAWEKPSASLAEQDYFLRVHMLIYRFTKEDMDKAREVALEGLERFPDSGLMRIKLGWILFNQMRFGWTTDPAQNLAEAKRFGEAGLADSGMPTIGQLHGHWLMALVHTWLRNPESALAEREKTLSFSPNDPELIRILSEVQVYSGLPGDAVESMKRAMELDPVVKTWPWPRGRLAFFYLMDGQYKNAIAEASALAQKQYLEIAAASAALGRLKDANAAMQSALAGDPGLSSSVIRQRNPFAKEEQLISLLTKAGLPQS